MVSLKQKEFKGTTGVAQFLEEAKNCQKNGNCVSYKCFKGPTADPFKEEFEVNCSTIGINIGTQFPGVFRMADDKGAHYIWRTSEKAPAVQFNFVG